MKNDVIVKSNSLINAKSKYKYSLNELKLICSLIANIRKDDKEFTLKQINISDLKFSEEEISNYKYLNDLCNSLLLKPFKIPNTNKWVNWFAMLEVENGCINYKIVDDLMPFLLDLQQNFTTYYLANVLKLRSSYSILIYEFLKQMEKVGYRKVSLVDLKAYLSLPSGYLNKHINLLLKQVKNDLKANTDISFSYKFEKNGRQFDSVVFSIETISTVDFVKKVRKQFVNKEIIVVDYENRKEILSVSEKGELYFLTNPFVKFSNSYAKKVWAMLYENKSKIQ